MRLILGAWLAAAWASDDVIVSGQGSNGGEAEVSVALGGIGRMTLGGFLDVGWFDAQGNGVAYTDRDAPGPRGTHTAWSFTGDPWAGTVNSLGEPADLGTDTTTTVARVDTLDSDGNPTFVVNQWHQRIDVSTNEHVAVRGAFDVAPRAGHLGSFGDVAWVDTAYVEWLPRVDRDFRLIAGKAESVFGREYYVRLAPDRYGITPSAIARYTTGTPVGLQARGSYRRWLEYAAALGNGLPVTERFGHFSEDVDSDGIPSGTLHTGVLKRGPMVGGELGLSGALGARGAGAEPLLMIGGDAALDVGPFEVRAELLRLRVPDTRGSPDAVAADGWFIDASALVLGRLRPHARVDRRDAELVTGPNHYRSDVVRVTGGARVDLDSHAALKLEYNAVREIEGPEIPDDVITTSAVFRF